ncbi:MAG: SH3 domain-containing protein [Eubacteriales bacterium]|nr:SH3 domain-containing protein [Eubacteriales bacterium]
MGDDVNMRLRPTTDSPVITQLDDGTRIGVYCEEGEGWYRIIYGNYRGYVSAEYVFLPSKDYLVANVIEGGLHLRQNPGLYSTIIRDLSEGTGLKILNMTGDWYYVEIEETNENGTIEVINGYVHKDYIKISNAEQPGTMIKIGMSGAEVRNIQQELRSRNFMIAPATGYFGEVTEGAVKAFQRKAGLAADGIVGPETYAMLFSDNGISTTVAEMFGITGEVKLSTWDEIDKQWKKGTTALVTDVKTGLQYTAYRFGGWYHADCEPYTAADTAIMLEIFGGEWSWNRRAIWVTLSNGVTYAASQHGMPHMVDVIAGNNFPGHFCIHFNDSKVHETSAECPRHQACVQYAYNAAH